MLWLLLLLIVIIIPMWNKITHHTKRNGVTKLKAVVVGYKRDFYQKEKGVIDLHHYPYVKIIGIDLPPQKLCYDIILSKTLKKGETISVFWYNNQLLYWNAYDISPYKFLPNSWNIFSK